MTAQTTTTTAAVTMTGGDVLEALERGRNCLVLTQWKDHVESLAGRLRDGGAIP